MAKNAASPEPVRGSPLKYISEGLSYAETITMNVSQHVIITTQDKVSLWLIEHVKLLERRREWTTPLGILVTLCLCLLTTGEFRTAVWVPSRVWEELLHFATLVSGVWLIWSLVVRSRAKSVTDVVSELKAGAELIVDRRTVSAVTRPQGIAPSYCGKEAE